MMKDRLRIDLLPSNTGFRTPSPNFSSTLQMLSVKTLSVRSLHMAIGQERSLV